MLDGCVETILVVWLLWVWDRLTEGHVFSAPVEGSGLGKREDGLCPEGVMLLLGGWMGDLGGLNIVVGLELRSQGLGLETTEYHKPI